MKWNQSIDPERINLKYQVLCIERLSEYRADWQGVTAEKIPLSPFKKGELNNKEIGTART